MATAAQAQGPSGACEWLLWQYGEIDRKFIVGPAGHRTGRSLMMVNLGNCSSGPGSSASKMAARSR
jgi:hypothetical protein